MNIKAMAGKPAFRTTDNCGKPCIFARASNSGRWHIYPVSPAGLVRFDLGRVCPYAYAADVRKSDGVELGFICGNTFLTHKEAKTIAAELKSGN